MGQSTVSSSRSSLSNLRLVQILLAVTAALYFLRGFFVARMFGVDFPFWLTIGVGVLLIPAIFLIRQPHRWIPNVLLAFSAAAVVVNVIMTIVEWHGLNVIVVIAVAIIALWMVLLGLSLLPRVRQDLGAAVR